MVFVVVVCLSVVCLNSGHASLYSHQKHKSESGFLLLSRPYQRISLLPIDYHHNTKSVFLVLLKEAKPLEREPSKPGKYFRSCGRRQRTGKTHPGDRGLSSKRSFAQNSSRVTVHLSLPLGRHAELTGCSCQAEFKSLGWKRASLLAALLPFKLRCF